jgi:hypothetical protein
MNEVVLIFLLGIGDKRRLFTVVHTRNGTERVGKNTVATKQK